jgi:hypothetical protein
LEWPELVLEYHLVYTEALNGLFELAELRGAYVVLRVGIASLEEPIDYFVASRVAELFKLV